MPGSVSRAVEGTEPPQQPCPHRREADQNEKATDVRLVQHSPKSDLYYARRSVLSITGLR